MSPGFFKPDNPAEKRRRLREMAIIGGLLATVAVLTYQLWDLPVTESGGQLPGSVLFLLLVDLNVILVLLLLFFVLRNVTKLVFERRKGVVGAKLRTRLTVAFVLLSLVPTLVLFFVATSLITQTFAARFTVRVEESLEQSLDVARVHYRQARARTARIGGQVAVIMRESRRDLVRVPVLQDFLERKRRLHGVAAITLYAPTKAPVAGAAEPEALEEGAEAVRPVSDAVLDKALAGQLAQAISPVGEAELVRSAVPVWKDDEQESLIGVLVVDELIPASLVASMGAIARQVDDYKLLKYYRPQITAPYKITLLLVTLLIIFAAMWFGLYLSRGITGPIRELAEGTRAIALGDYDVHIDVRGEDEISMLVESFNRMAMDVKSSKLQLEGAMQDLEESAQEIEKRRAYMEIVLRNVGAGVVSVDQHGRISTINLSAANLFGVDATAVVGRRWSDILTGEQQTLVTDALERMTQLRLEELERQLQVQIGDETHTILVHVNRLADDEGKDLGLVVVFEDLTELVKAQRASAWREVARRIAHEIKNPLTPIQLSAQRLRRKYGSRLGEDRAVFDECIDTIVKQVGDLKFMVNEFSNFARLPATTPKRNDLNRVIREATVLFAEGHKRIHFDLDLSDEVPEFDFDAEQIKRVLTNIFDNALDAIEGKGNVQVATRHNALLDLVRLEISNDGRPIPTEMMGRLFEPYFSTKRRGTGLGLAIVKTIINDHAGYIRVRPNRPRGTTFTIELPVKAAA